MGTGITIESRIGASPREHGSTSGATCPDVLSLEGGAIGVIGEAYEDHQEELTAVVLPEKVVIDAFADLLHR